MINAHCHLFIQIFQHLMWGSWYVMHRLGKLIKCVCVCVCVFVTSVITDQCVLVFEGRSWSEYQTNTHTHKPVHTCYSDDKSTERLIHIKNKKTPFTESILLQQCNTKAINITNITSVPVHSSVVEHCVSSTKGCGFNSQRTHVLNAL